MGAKSRGECPRLGSSMCGDAKGPSVDCGYVDLNGVRFAQTTPDPRRVPSARQLDVRRREGSGDAKGPSVDCGNVDSKGMHFAQTTPDPGDLLFANDFRPRLLSGGFGLVVGE